MKLVNMVCPNCGASLQVDADKKNLTCSYCGNNIIVDDEVKHIRYDNAEQTGYEFEKGRQRAQAERNTSNSVDVEIQPKKKRTWLWVLGWILMFPVPLTILIIRSKKMKMPIKIAIIAAAWIVYLVIGFSGRGSETNEEVSNNEAVENVNSVEDITEINKEAAADAKEEAATETNKEVAAESQATEKEEEVNPYQDLDDFISSFNEVSDIQIVSQEEIDIHDTSGGYYRTEFRLQAYEGAIAYHLVFSDDSSADLIDTANWADGNTVNGSVNRIYVLASSKESFESLFKSCWKVLHGDKVTDAQVDEELQKIMHPYNEDKMEYLVSSGSGYIENTGFAYDIKEKQEYYDFFID
ncbi:TFIIB-type zinc ribbon-containing protein [Butyrivibrio sp. TB]|uniref:TFIIB-type zinc ribbon-containing protein n=1 Tax=Butyrivibrio sp. TB TaxID=1520809 RepID=UPI0008CBA6EB|nr:TFIIB-type zinc ribbon-containing protein [Butyrivibrio sp. TB]SEQ56343.1 hypothetical protein SAMN02910382_03435 [Butyrivibrio sp. TB]